jgi:peptide/nickel transport system substrate-binding protein
MKIRSGISSSTVGSTERFRHSRRHRFGAALAACCIVLAGTTVASAASRPASSGPQRGGTLTLVGAFNEASLDPAAPLFGAGSGSLFDRAIFDSLFLVNAKGAVIPELVKSWTLSSNKRVYTWNLQQGVKFQDGTPFNASAVKWNLDREMSPAQGCTCLSAIADISSVTTKGKYTVIVMLASPLGTFLPVLESTSADMPASPTAFAAEGASQFAVDPIGPGPFKVASDTLGTQLVLTRSSDYWKKGQPYLDGVTVNIQSNITTSFATMESGAAQFVFNADTTTADLVQQNPSQYKLLAAPATSWTAIAFNTLQPPFNNPMARQAVAEALNPALINTTLYAGNNTVGNSIFGTGMDEYLGKNVPGGPTYNDPTDAAALVKQLGGLSFTLGAENVTPSAVLAALQSQLNAAGMKVTINDISRTAGLAAEEAGNYTAFLSGDAASPDDYVYASEFFTNGSEFNKDLNDPTLTQMVNQSLHVGTQSGRIAAFTKIMEYVNKNLYFVPLWTSHTIDVIDTNVKGIPDTTSLDLNAAYLS